MAENCYETKPGDVMDKNKVTNEESHCNSGTGAALERNYHVIILVALVCMAIFIFGIVCALISIALEINKVKLVINENEVNSLQQQQYNMTGLEQPIRIIHPTSNKPIRIIHLASNKHINIIQLASSKCINIIYPDLASVSKLYIRL